METPTADLVLRLVEALVLDGFTTAGHAATRLHREHRGGCPPGNCRPMCRGHRVLRDEALAWLEASAAEHTRPRQLALGEPH